MFQYSFYGLKKPQHGACSPISVLLVLVEATV